MIHIETPALAKGMVEFVELPGALSESLRNCLEYFPEDLDQFLNLYAYQRFSKGNLVFSYPRRQYAKLDRGEMPDVVNARYFTLSNNVMADPAVEVVTEEAFRVATSTRAADPFKPQNSIIRFILDVGQFVGSWKTAVLIGGADASLTPGTGKVIAAVNDVKDDSGIPLNRDGTTVHLVNWQVKHLDSSEI